MTHTPKPWDIATTELCNLTILQIIAWRNSDKTAGFIICEIGGNTEENKANARLIAAAPEMKTRIDELEAINAQLLEACEGLKKLTRLPEFKYILDGLYQVGESEYLYTIEKAEVAIAAAKGGE